MDDDEMMDDAFSDDGDATNVLSWIAVVETKCYYAGGSARFMFDSLFSELRGELDRFCNNVVYDNWKYCAFEYVGSGTPSAVTTCWMQQPI